MPTTSISSCWNTRRWLALKSRRRKISIKYITPPGGPFPGGNAAESAKLNANNQYQFMLEHATLVSAQVPEAEDLGDFTSLVAGNNGYSAKISQSDQEV